MENCPEANIHSYKDLRNGKMLGILKDKTLSIFFFFLISKKKYIKRTSRKQEA